MRIHNLYTDEKGESHFRDIEIEWAEERRGSKLSKRLPANGIIFRETRAEYDLDWHPAPRRQYIVNLDAGVQILDTRRCCTPRLSSATARRCSRARATWRRGACADSSSSTCWCARRRLPLSSTSGSSGERP